MQTISGPFEIEFLSIPAGKICVGTDKGGWVHASERPRHEVVLPEFLIMKNPLSTADAARIMGEPIPDIETPLDLIDSEIIAELCRRVAIEADGETRPPSQAEWEHAQHVAGLNLPCDMTEILADHPSANHRGAPLDGRPRINSENNVTIGQRVAYSCHPKKADVVMRCVSPIDRPLTNVVFRMSISPRRLGTAVTVPEHGDFSAGIRSELLWVFLIGIIPSFTIPLLRGFSDYALDGWVNLLFGGLCIGFVSGAFWRPRRPTFYQDQNGQIITRSRSAPNRTLDE
jgi:hypothetical protein